MASILEENPWLRDPATRKKSIRVAVVSSSAVEGIRVKFASTKKAKNKNIKIAAKKKVIAGRTKLRSAG